MTLHRPIGKTLNNNLKKYWLRNCFSLQNLLGSEDIKITWQLIIISKTMLVPIVVSIYQ
jgi:hypothetical protein